MGLYPQCDVYDYASELTPAERSAILRLRAFLDAEVAPIVDDHWERGLFPEHLIERIAGLRLLDPEELRRAGEAVRPLFEGFRLFEIARVDASMATYFSGQATMITSAILHGASDEQRAGLMRQVVEYRLRGVFAITEPEHGSDVARGLESTAVRDGDEWVLNGAKRWIGSAAYATHVCVVAKEESSGAMRAFLVPRDSAGFEISRIPQKASLRIVNNADIVMRDVRVPDSLRLHGVDTFADVARMLRHMRASVVWLAAGLQAGAYEAALRYIATREQFGRPLARFQLVQGKVARMLDNVTAGLGYASRVARMHEEGKYADEHSALAKYAVSRMMRETVAIARELCGGNGIVLGTGVMRHFCDAEAVYTYEGTDEISGLVATRAATGTGAFV
ncbi:acyl-CoA dehydrogenase family protein [Leucobacter allii]|uniref:Acyl-CoA dehydrogenase family protein n=1 Tax=Leucobacter allii TaxID=2932247 RepID=A0ABY4FIR1_9MICO|nr:acyl-CoA dehydrogenase family protein [Leucobacter allii]UOQ56445.1 acyl-CoA dehydrogenase family protein [Leucobacter allii]